MSSACHLTSPVPDLPSYVHVGRGGAGNIAPRHHPPKSKSSATTKLFPFASTSTNNAFSSDPELANYVYPPPKGLSHHKPRPRRHHYRSTGRGGRGNFSLHPASEHAIFSFDEELERLNEEQEKIAPVIHIGRGGGGYDNQEGEWSRATDDNGVEAGMIRAVERGMGWTDGISDSDGATEYTGTSASTNSSTVMGSETGSESESSSTTDGSDLELLPVEKRRRWPKHWVKRARSGIGGWF